MKIACISDTHMQHRGLTILPCDILIHAGDCFRTNKEEEIRDFFEWFGDQSSTYKLLVPGNHDRLLEKKIAKYGINLHDSFKLLDNCGILINNLKIWGIPYVSKSLKNILQGIADDSEQIEYSKIPVNTDILISHNAPKGILDDSSMEGNRIGSSVLLKKVNEIKPKYHIFGHVHNQYGTFRTDHTVFVNASLTNDAEVLINKPIYFEI